MKCKICDHSSLYHLSYGDYKKCKENNCTCIQFELKTENHEIIDNEFMILDLLFIEEGSNLKRYIHYTDDIGYYLTDEAYYKSTYFSITKRCVDSLKSNYYIDGKKHWGYSDMTELIISDIGKMRLYDIWKSIGVNIWKDNALRTRDWIKAYK